MYRSEVKYIFQTIWYIYQFTTNPDLEAVVTFPNPHTHS